MLNTATPVEASTGVAVAAPTRECLHCGRYSTDNTHPDRCGRRSVLRLYGRRDPSDKPTFCGPSAAERAGDIPRKQGPASDGKPIYDTREAAEAAARWLERLGCPPQRAYPCKRSEHGHHHLTTKPRTRPHPPTTRPALIRQHVGIPPAILAAMRPRTLTAATTP